MVKVKERLRSWQINYCEGMVKVRQLKDLSKVGKRLWLWLKKKNQTLIASL